MIKNVVRSEDVGIPIISSTGEKIYELIGRAAVVKTSLISVAHVELSPDVSSPKHSNKGVELYHMVKGSAEVIIGGKHNAFVFGDYCLLEPGVVHQIINKSSETVGFDVISAPAWRSEDQIVQ